MMKLNKTRLFINFLIVFALLDFFLFFQVNKALGALPIDDVVILFEYGLKIVNSSVIQDRPPDNSMPSCKYGVCIRNRGYTSTTFYKTTENKILSQEEWQNKNLLEKPGCEGFVTKEKEIDKYLEEWRRSPERKEFEKQFEDPKTIKERDRQRDLDAQRIAKFMVDKGLDFYQNVDYCYEFNRGDHYHQYISSLIADSVYEKTLYFPSSSSKKPRIFLADLKTGLKLQLGWWFLIPLALIELKIILILFKRWKSKVTLSFISWGYIFIALLILIIFAVFAAYLIKQKMADENTPIYIENGEFRIPIPG